MRTILFCSIAVGVLCSTAVAGDFAQWRGPNRNGIAAEGVPLADAWPESGPPLLWTSEAIPENGDGGFSCPVVADGKVFVYLNKHHNVPFEQRVLTANLFRRLGGFAVAMPADLEKAVEAARASEERAKLKGKTLGPWIEKFKQTHLKTEEMKKKYARIVHDRLRRGKKALPLELLATLATITDRTFASQGELDAWFAENDVTENQKKAVMRVIPTYHARAWDQVYCLNFADGKTLWKVQTDGRRVGWSCSTSLCVADGKVYGANSIGEVYCLSAADGSDLWRVKASKALLHTSPMVLDGKVIVLADKLKALDAADGKVLWEQPKVAGRDNSPVLWTHGGKQYVICNTGKDVHCVDPADGRLLWSAPGGGQGSPTVVGDLLALVTKNKKVGTVVYKITPEGAEPIFSDPKMIDGATCPILLDGHLYVVRAKQTVCINLADGKVAWEQKVGTGWNSPVLADGKLLAHTGKEYWLIAPTPKAFTKLAAFAPPLSGNHYSSPAVVDGKLVVRLKAAVACYDISAAGVNAASEKPTEK